MEPICLESDVQAPHGTPMAPPRHPNTPLCWICDAHGTAMGSALGPMQRHGEPIGNPWGPLGAHGVPLGAHGTHEETICGPMGRH